MAEAQEDKEENKNSKGSLKGCPPTKFDGNRKMAKKFLNDFKTYQFLVIDLTNEGSSSDDEEL